MWLYQGKEIKSLKDIEELWGSTPHGFIYEIEDANGRKYIGQKILREYKPRIIGKRELAKEGKRKFRKRKNKKSKQWVYYEERYKESNWLYYTGSCDELNKNIEKGLDITKRILIFVERKGLMHYLETKYIFCSGALESEDYYNRHALSKFFKNNILKTD